MACIQESKLRPASKSPSFPDFAVIREDRAGGGGGGLLTLIHHSVQFTRLQSPFNDGVTECILINAAIAGLHLRIANIYIPPASSANLPPGFHASISPLFADNAVICGDVNAHSEEWSLGATDARGDLLASEIDAHNFVVMNNPDIATRPTSDSSPDLALAHPSIALNFEWSAHTTLNSDHLPLSLSFEDNTPPQRSGRTYVNFKKARWNDFTRESEELFSRLQPPSSCAQGEREWRRILQKCSSHHIPAGYYRTFAPGLDAASASLVDERDRRRRRDPNDPSLEDLNRQIASSISASARQRWMEVVKEADRRTNPPR